MQGTGVGGDGDQMKQSEKQAEIIDAISQLLSLLERGESLSM